MEGNIYEGNNEYIRKNYICFVLFREEKNKWSLMRTKQWEIRKYSPEKYNMDVLKYIKQI